MDVEAIIRMGTKLYEAKRSLEQDVSGSEQLLFEACSALKQLQAEAKKLKLVEAKAIELVFAFGNMTSIEMSESMANTLEDQIQALAESLGGSK